MFSESGAAQQCFNAGRKGFAMRSHFCIDWYQQVSCRYCCQRQLSAPSAQRASSGTPSPRSDAVDEDGNLLWAGLRQYGSETTTAGRPRCRCRPGSGPLPLLWFAGSKPRICAIKNSANKSLSYATNWPPHAANSGHPGADRPRKGSWSFHSDASKTVDYPPRRLARLGGRS
jgi:hypothetical protein